mgnify:CR=1 FL=1
MHWSEKSGVLYKAKNFATDKAEGKVFCFVDDDAEFLENTVEIAMRQMESKNIDAIAGRCIDRNGHDSVQKFFNEEAILTLKDFEGKFIESTMFFKRDVFVKYMFDNEMGVGCFYGSEEGYDLVYRMLLENVIIKYCPDLKFYHPQKITEHADLREVRRAYSYRCGFGYLCRKHKFYLKFLSRCIKVSAYLCILPLYKRSSIKYYRADLLGSLVGFYL